MKAVMIIMPYDTAVALYGDLSGQKALSPETEADAAKCVAQSIGKPLAIDKDVVSPVTGTDP